MKRSQPKRQRPGKGKTACHPFAAAEIAERVMKYARDIGARDPITFIPRTEMVEKKPDSRQGTQEPTSAPAAPGAIPTSVGPPRPATPPD